MSAQLAQELGQGCQGCGARRRLNWHALGYAAGASLGELAATAGVTTRQVSRLLRAAGVPLRAGTLRPTARAAARSPIAPSAAASVSAGTRHRSRAHAPAAAAPPSLRAATKPRAAPDDSQRPLLVRMAPQPPARGLRARAGF